MHKVLLAAGQVKKLLIMHTLFLSLLTFHSCTVSKTEKISTRDSSSLNSISLFMQDDPRSLDPRSVRLLSNITLAKHLFEGLLKESSSEENRLEYGIASSYQVSDNNTYYTFFLKDALWSNGDPVTSYDFKESWIQIIQGKVPSIFYYAFMDIKNAKEVRCGTLSPYALGIYCPNAKTLIVELDKPIYHFLKFVTLPAFAPVHRQTREAIESPNPGMPFPVPITNGPFKIKKIRSKQYIKLSKNPFYHEANQVLLSSIDIKIIPDVRTANLLFKKGKIDWQGPPWSDDLPLEISKTLSTKGLVNKFNVAGTSWLIFNANRFPFNNAKLRQALSLAIDREDLVYSVLNGKGVPTKHILPPCLFKPDTGSVHQNEGNIEEAKRLFDEAISELGISVHDFKKYPLLFPSAGSNASLIAQIITQSWKEIFGISIPLQGLEFGTLHEQTQTESFYLAFGDWMADFSDPMSFLSIFSSPFGIRPYMIKNPDFTKLLSDIGCEHDLELRNQLISQAVDILEHEGGVVPLFHHSFEYIRNKSLVNFGISNLGTVDLKTARLQPHSKYLHQTPIVKQLAS